jgi:hypothetical protein
MAIISPPGRVGIDLYWLPLGARGNVMLAAREAGPGRLAPGGEAVRNCLNEPKERSLVES